MFNVECWMLNVECWMFNVYPNSTSFWRIIQCVFFKPSSKIVIDNYFIFSPSLHVLLPLFLGQYSGQNAFLCGDKRLIRVRRLGSYPRNGKERSLFFKQSAICLQLCCHKYLCRGVLFMWSFVYTKCYYQFHPLGLEKEKKKKGKKVMLSKPFPNIEF